VIFLPCHTTLAAEHVNRLSNHPVEQAPTFQEDGLVFIMHVWRSAQLINISELLPPPPPLPKVTYPLWRFEGVEKLKC
jgi:hypothetical protein